MHTPELPDAVATKLVEVIALVRELDLKKPPSIAESIDWARALLLLGADEHRRGRLPLDDEHHRQAPHRPRRGGRARRRAARPGRALVVSLPARIVDFAEALRAEGVAIGTSELLDAFAALDAVPWTDRGPFREALAATLAKSPEDRRVFDLVFDRFFFRAVEEQAVAPRRARARRVRWRSTGGEQIDLDNLREQAIAGDPRGRRERDARPRPARDRRVRPPRRGLRRARRRRPADPPRARPAHRRPARGRTASRSRATRSAASSSSCGASSSARRSSARSSSRPRGRSTSSTARCRPGRSRTSPRCTAS